MRIETELKLGFKDVLILPKRSTLNSRSEVDLNRTFTFLHSGNTWTGIPVVCANMDTLTTPDMFYELDKFNMFTVLSKHRSIEDFYNDSSIKFDNLSLSIGIVDQVDDLPYKMYKKKGLNTLCLDVANGYTERFINFVSKVREQMSDITIIAGNVCTPEITEQILLAGADIVKVGIGGGSVCTTRIKTGVGFPQLSAVIECGDAAHGLGGHIISDGNCVVPGDIVKAFGGNADFVMIGGMLAGHDECAGATYSYDEDGRRCLEGYDFYGMASKNAMGKYDDEIEDYKTTEGKEVKVQRRGPVKNTINDILGGLRSACTYVGAKRLKEFSKRTSFILVKEQENKVFG